MSSFVLFPVGLVPFVTGSSHRELDVRMQAGVPLTHFLSINTSLNPFLTIVAPPGQYRLWHTLRWGLVHRMNPPPVRVAFFIRLVVTAVHNDVRSLLGTWRTRWVSSLLTRIGPGSVPFLFAPVLEFLLQSGERPSYVHFGAGLTRGALR